MNQGSMRIGETPAAAGNSSLDTVAVLEQLLVQSIRLRDLHINARWQISDGQFNEIREMLNDHRKQQLSLIGSLVDRIRMLGGAAGIFASDFLQRTPFVRVIRGPRALKQLLLDLLEAHEAILNGDDLHLARDFTVGQVVLTNEEQWEDINDKIRSPGPQRRLSADE